ncbi:MAG: hypothetical protein AAFX94_06565 [Myxococcota bacterium]
MPFLEYSLGLASNIGSFGRLQVHAEMLRDEKRTLAFARAIAGTVEPGDHVLEIGAGVGVLSHFALEAGASKVTAVEASGAADFAALTLTDPRVTLIRKHSEESR